MYRMSTSASNSEVAKVCLNMWGVACVSTNTFTSNAETLKAITDALGLFYKNNVIYQNMRC